MLLNNKVLEHLKVNNCGLEDDGVIEIAKCKLKMDKKSNTVSNLLILGLIFVQ